jgi:hypothetical protein
MLRNALYRYVLRRLEETKQELECTRHGLELYHEMYGDDGVAPWPAEEATISEVIQKCALFRGRFPPWPPWLARLALRWEINKKRGLL